jgi:hypothetical protein
MAAAVHPGQITRALLHRRVLTRAFYEYGFDCLQHLNHRRVALGNARVIVRLAVKAHRLIHLVAHAFRHARDANAAAAGAFAASTTFFRISVFSPEAATTTIVLAFAIF